METLCLPISFQKISPRWLMTIASLIVSRKDEWNHISKESNHLQSQSCTTLSPGSGVRNGPTEHTGGAGPRKEVRLQAGDEAGAEQAVAEHLTVVTNQVATQVTGQNTLSLCARGGADKLQTLQISVWCPFPHLLAAFTVASCLPGVQWPCLYSGAGHSYFPAARSTRQGPH